MSENPRVGEILVQAGVIDEMQLASALGEQARWGRHLGVTLIKMGMVEERDLIRALATQLDLPVASLAGKRISDDVIALVPARIAAEHGVIPLFLKKEDGRTTRLFLGMEDPSNLAVLDDLSFSTGMKIEPVMVGPSELGEAVDRYYLRSAAKDAKQVSPETPAESSGMPAGDAMGEQSLRAVTDEQTPPGLRWSAAPVATTPGDAARSPVSSEPSIELKEISPARPDGLFEDLAHAVEETEQTRKVVRAIVQILIEKGALSLEELQAQIAQQKSGETL